MAKTKYLVVMVLFFGIIVSSGCLFDKIDSGPSDEVKNLYKFLHLRGRLQDRISGTERSRVNFAIAEYYFKVNDLIDTKSAFEGYVKENPIGITTLLANVYLYKMAQLENNQAKIAALKKEMFKEQFILLFNKYKILSYTSLYGNKYEVHYFVDRIEIFLNGDIFERVSP